MESVILNVYVYVLRINIELVRNAFPVLSLYIKIRPGLVHRANLGAPLKLARFPAFSSFTRIKNSSAF